MTNILIFELRVEYRATATATPHGRLPRADRARIEAKRAGPPLAALGFGRYPADAVTDTRATAFLTGRRRASRRDALGRGVAPYILTRYPHDSESSFRGFMGSIAR